MPAPDRASPVAVSVLAVISNGAARQQKHERADAGREEDVVQRLYGEADCTDTCPTHPGGSKGRGLPGRQRGVTAGWSGEVAPVVDGRTATHEAAHGRRHRTSLPRSAPPRLVHTVAWRRRVVMDWAT